MLALPERVPEPPTLSLAELQALSAWKRRYRAEAAIDAANLSSVEIRHLRSAGLSAAEIRRMRFLAWAYSTGTGHITP